MILYQQTFNVCVGGGTKCQVYSSKSFNFSLPLEVAKASNSTNIQKAANKEINPQSGESTHNQLQVMWLVNFKPINNTESNIANVFIP